jgi:hypothetical protein
MNRYNLIKWPWPNVHMCHVCKGWTDITLLNDLDQTFIYVMYVKGWTDITLLNDLDQTFICVMYVKDEQI